MLVNKRLFLIVFLAVSVFMFATDYYVDTEISSSCADYDPTSFACGSGAYQCYKTAEEVETNVTSSGDNVYFRKGQTFTEASDFEPSAGVTYSAFGTGANPILSFTVDNALDWRNDDDGAVFENLDIRTTGGFAVRLYSTTGNPTFNMSDCTLTGLGGITLVSTGATTITLAIDGVVVEATSSEGFLSTTGTTTIDGTIANSDFHSSGNVGILHSTGTIDGLTISDTDISNNGTNKHGISLVGVISGSGLSLTDCTVNSNGYNGLYVSASSTAMAGIYIDGGTYSNNGRDAEYNGIRIQQSATGSIDDVIITGTTVDGNSNDGIGTAGTITNVLIGGTHANGNTVTNNGTDGVGADGDGIALHDATSGEISYNLSTGNLKSQFHAIGDCDVVVKYNVFSGSDPTLANIYIEDGSTSEIYNNTSIITAVTPASPNILIGADGSSGDHNMRNNILLGGTYLIDNQADDTPTLLADYNNYYGYLTGDLNNISDDGNSLAVDADLSVTYLPATNSILNSGILISGIHNVKSGQTDYAGEHIAPYGIPIGARGLLRPGGGTISR